MTIGKPRFIIIHMTMKCAYINLTIYLIHTNKGDDSETEDLIF